jgi:hypothetical protein
MNERSLALVIKKMERAMGNNHLLKVLIRLLKSSSSFLINSALLYTFSFY